MALLRQVLALVCIISLPVAGCNRKSEREQRTSLTGNGGRTAAAPRDVPGGQENVSSAKTTRNTADAQTPTQVADNELPPGTAQGNRDRGDRKLVPVKDPALLAALGAMKRGRRTPGSASEVLGSAKPDELLPVIAYALTDDVYRDSALRYIALTGLRVDDRLAPFLAHCIMESSGATLATAVSIATRTETPPCVVPALVPALLERALESSYERWSTGRDHPRFISVFNTAAEAIWEMTDGQIGAKYLDGVVPEQEKAKLRKRWREWWDENGEEWTKVVRDPEIRPLKEDSLVAMIRSAHKGDLPDSESRSRLRGIGREKLKAVLAYALGDPVHGSFAVKHLLGDERLWDNRLAPFLATYIGEADGEDLLLAVKLAGVIRDARLVPPLLEHALRSDHESKTEYPPGVRPSAFAVAAEALWRTTDGRIGATGIRTLPSKEERLKLRREWHKWWEENKDRWKPRTSDSSTRQ